MFFSVLLNEPKLKFTYDYVPVCPILACDTTGAPGSQGPPLQGAFDACPGAFGPTRAVMSGETAPVIESGLKQRKPEIVAVSMPADALSIQATMSRAA